MKVYTVERRSPKGWVVESLEVIRPLSTGDTRVQEVELSLCPTCNAPCLGTMSCDHCGTSHCDACTGTDHRGNTLCLQCATLIDTVWGRFLRIPKESL